MLSQSLAMREGREKILLPKLVPCTRKITLHVSDRTEPNRRRTCKSVLDAHHWRRRVRGIKSVITWRRHVVLGTVGLDQVRLSGEPVGRWETSRSDDVEWRGGGVGKMMWRTGQR